MGYHGTMVPWYHGTIVTWYYGTMVPWYHGTMIPWHHCEPVKHDFSLEPGKELLTAGWG